MIICYSIILSGLITKTFAVESSIDQTLAQVTDNVLEDKEPSKNDNLPNPQTKDNIQFTKQQTPYPDTALKVLENHDALLFQLTEYEKATRFEIYRGTTQIAVVELLTKPNREGDNYEFKYLHSSTKETDSDGKTKFNKLELKNNCIYLVKAKIHNESTYRCKYAWDGQDLNSDTMKLRQLKVVRIPKLRIDSRAYLAADSNKTVKVASCTASSARPKAKLKWSFQPGFDIPKNWKSEMIKIEDKSTIDHLTKSEINFVLESKFDGNSIYCELVEHPSLELVKQSDNREQLMKESPPRIEFKLDIKFKPEVPVIEAISSKNSNNQATNFKCHSNANPPANYEWYLDDEYMTDKTPTFDISDKEYDFNSTIKCTAKNERGQESNSEIYNDLNIQFAALHVDEGNSGTIIWVLAVFGLVLVLFIIVVCIKRCLPDKKIPEEIDEEKRDLKPYPQGFNQVNEISHISEQEYSKANLPPVQRQFVEEASSDDHHNNYENGENINHDDTQNLQYTDIMPLPESDNNNLRSDVEDLDKTYYDDPETRYNNRSNINNTSS